MAVAALAGAATGMRPSTPLLFLAFACCVAWAVAGGRSSPCLVLLAGLLFSALSVAAWEGTAGGPDGPVAGLARLVGDPRPLPAGGWRAEVRLDGRRYDAEFGAAHSVVAGLLAGEGIEVQAVLDGSPRRWQRARHVAGTLTVLGVGGVAEAGRVHRLANALRRTLASGAEVLDPPASALLAGLVVGDDRAQGDLMADDFRAAGLGHLLAVSGQNVAFVLAAAGPLLLRTRFAWRLPLTLALLCFFALTTRFEPSVLRATVMAGGSAVAATGGRQVGGLRLLAASVLALLAVDPLLVHRAAFQLSVAASAGILVAARPLAGALPWPRPLAEAAGVTLAAQAAVTPLLLTLFGPVPIAALPANLLAAPVAGPLMVWGMTGGLLAGVVGPLGARVIHSPSRLGLWWVAEVAGLAGRWSPGLLAAPAALVVTALVGAAAAASGLGSPGVARRILAATFGSLLLVALVQVGRGTAAGSADGIRVLDAPAGIVVVERHHSARGVLEGLRSVGVRNPGLLVFREPVVDGVAEALGARYGHVRLLGPPGSAGAEVPPDGMWLGTAGGTWQVDVDGSRLLIRRLPGLPGPGGAERWGSGLRVPSEG